MNDIIQELAFPQAEYRARLEKVQLQMDDAGLDWLLVHNLANICYLTGHQTPLADWYHCLLVPRDGEVVLQTCDPELAAIHTNVPVIEEVDWENMDLATEELARLLTEREAGTARIGLEMRRPGLNAFTDHRLRQCLPRVEFVDASELILGIRAVKSPAEIAHLRRAASFSVLGMQAAIDNLAAGITDNAVCASAMASMLRAGSEFFSIDPIVRTGRRSSVTHATCKRNRIERGDAVLVELGGVFQRYCAPLLRTAVLGAPSAKLRELADRSLDTMEALFAELKPGRTLDEVARCTANAVPATDLAIKTRGYFGYAVGISFPPVWVERSVEIAEGRSEILTPGMVFHAHRSMRISGVAGVGFSETVAITESGHELLTHFPRELIVCD